MNIASAYIERDEEIQCVIKCRNEIEDSIHTLTHIQRKRGESAKQTQTAGNRAKEWERAREKEN